MQANSRVSALAWVAFIVRAVQTATAQEPTDGQIRFFETRIRPVLVERCYDCHGADWQGSDLRLDSLEAIAKGGKAGPALVPGKPQQSLLITAIGYRDQTLQMPLAEKLSDKQIADLTEW